VRSYELVNVICGFVIFSGSQERGKETKRREEGRERRWN
jgi:hypothetical protein